MNWSRIKNNIVFRLLRKTNLSFWIILALPIGIILGNFAPKFSVNLVYLSNLFLNMIKIIVVPLIFSTLYVGIVGHGNHMGTVGRLALKCLIYFEAVTTLALIFGLVMANIAKPGKGVNVSDMDPEGLPPTTSHKWYDYLNDAVPTSFFKAAVDDKVLQIVFCSAMFSVAAAKLPEEKRKGMNDFLFGLSEIMFKVVGLVMNFAPVGVLSAVASTIGKNGLSVLASLGKLVGYLYITLILFILLVIIPILLVAKINPIKFFKQISQPVILGFTTASSESALPIALRLLEEFGLPYNIVAFVLPVGYSFNLDGSTLYLALAAIFCAQASDINLPISKQIVLMLTLMLSSKGVAAVPRASLVVLLGALSSFNIPRAPVSLILGVDAFMDMARTCTNIIGNCAAAAVISRWEGAYPPYGRWEGRWANMNPNIKDRDSDNTSEEDLKAEVVEQKV
ncbi:hypothetical protein BB560_003710 [Smittium megazygosporum]|uniref:Amino acid transporter n=1 Tax=Smittium megazygosporum TaxID=133381 RepID=A0A2T9ZB99_9FUNG|nr:hypothetical protein BB560_003710 [Smittium megazygosporum]